MILGRGGEELNVKGLLVIFKTNLMSEVCHINRKYWLTSNHFPKKTF